MALVCAAKVDRLWTSLNLSWSFLTSAGGSSALASRAPPYQLPQGTAYADSLLLGKKLRGSKMGPSPPSPPQIMASRALAFLRSYIRARSSGLASTLTPTAFQYLAIMLPASTWSLLALEISMTKLKGWPSGRRRMPLASLLGSTLSRYSLAFLTSYSVYCVASCLL